jgi:hypothetical protein
VILRGGSRDHSVYDGIESWHCFSAGANYDPDNISFGALVGFDEHLVSAGAGFDWHAHRGVEIVSYVISGALRHEDDRGTYRIVRAGEIFMQSAADGIRHRETNASSVDALRMVQMTVLSPADARFELWHGSGQGTAERWHLFVVDGDWQLGGDALSSGDAVRGSGDLAIRGDGRLLVWWL